VPKPIDPFRTSKPLQDAVKRHCRAKNYHEVDRTFQAFFAVDERQVSGKECEKDDEPQIKEVR